MTLYQIIRRLETFSLTLPNVRTASDGDVYAGLNDNPELKYGVFFITQNTHQELEDMDRYGLTLFYIDRLDDTLEDNRLQIQSIGKEVLSVILRDFCEEYNIDFPTVNYTPFTQKFKDETAGVYAQITLDVIKGICADDFSDIISIYQTKTVNLTENGQFIVTPDESYSALEKVIINVDVESESYEQGFEDGFESGVTNQKNKLTSIYIDENGQYNRTDGFSSVTVNVPQSGGGDYQQGYEDGVEYQKSLLSSATFNQNGNYTNENGYSAVTVSVPQTGHTDQELQDAYQSGITYQKSLLSAITITENGNYNRADGYSAITVGIDTQAYYNSGYTSGITYQKSLLSSTAFTENGDYTRTNGWSAVTVNIDTQAYWDSGYTSGYTDGINKPTLLVSPSSLNVPETGAIKQITIASNTGWTITNYPNWVTLSSVSGTGWTTIDVTVAKDADSVTRTGSITIKTTDNSVIRTVSILQEADYYPKGDASDYLTITALSGGTFWFRTLKPGTGETISFEISINGGEWQTKSSSVAAGNSYVKSITLSTGDVMRVRGNNLSYDRKLAFFAWNGLKYKVEGNIMSLINKTNFSGMTTLSSANTFWSLFWSDTGESGLYDASGLILPATTLSESCYRDMFRNCVHMATAPELPASTLAPYCYQDMFYGCSGLNNIKCLATDISAQDCTTGWVDGVAATGTFYRKYGMAGWTRGVNGVPVDWTVISV